MNQAGDSARQAVAANPDLAAAHEVLGATLLETGETGPAKDEIERARQLDPLNPAVYVSLAKLTAKSGQGRAEPLTSADFRFTQKGATLYAFSMGRPEERITIPALAQGGSYSVGQIRHVGALGSKVKLNWTQDKLALTIAGTPSLSDYPTAFKILGAQG